jgi:uncharacterized protein with PIN domain
MKHIVLLNTRSSVAAGLLCATIALPLFAADLHAAPKGEKPKASPGWIVVEEDIWYPWVYEPLDWFHNADMQYRRSEEKAAAAELRKCEAWLKFAAGHAQPITKQSLDAAAADLHSLANDLEKGRISTARQFDNSLAKANRALAEWHYFQADKQLAQDEEQDAAQNLQAAARYLKCAADSARYEYGDDFVTTYDDLTGWTVTERVPNTLNQNLTVIKAELAKLGNTLAKDANAK